MLQFNKNIFSLILLVNILFMISGTKAYSNNLVSFLEEECKNSKKRFKESKELFSKSL